MPNPIQGTEYFMACSVFILFDRLNSSYTLVWQQYRNTYVLDCDCSISCGAAAGSFGTDSGWGRCQEHQHCSAGGAVVRWYWQYLLLCCCWQSPRLGRVASSARRYRWAGRRCWTSPRQRLRCPQVRVAVNLADRAREKGKLKFWHNRNNCSWSGTHPGDNWKGTLKLSQALLAIFFFITVDQSLW